MRDFESAYEYYNRYISIKEAYNLDIYRSEDLKIARVLAEVGFAEKAENYAKAFKEYSEYETSVYKQINLAIYSLYEGNAEKALEQMKLFAQESNFHYWTVIFLTMDPIMGNVRDLPEFKQVYGEIETSFWNQHTKIRATLEEKGLI